MKDFFEAPIKWLEGWGANAGFILVILGVVAVYYVFQLFAFESSKTVGFMLATLPIWLPVITFYLFYEWWMLYVRKAFDLDAGRVTLEIKLPQEIYKSPEAVELILNQLYQTASPDNHIQTYWDGKHPPVFGLEIVSRGGNVKFYVSTPRKKFKHMVETQFYAQYPGIEIRELELDYTAEFPWDPEKYGYFSFHYGLKKPDAYPIKTYFDFGLHAMPKEEEKNDPLTVMLDALGSIKPGENLWIQILISAHREQTFKTGSLKKVPDWQKDVEEEIGKIIEKAKKRGVSEEDDSVSMTQLTGGEKSTIDSLERSMSKYAFETRIRGMYIAKKDAFVGERMGMLAGIFREYDDLSRNQIAPKWRTDTDWPWWQDRKGKKVASWKRQEFYEHKKRTLLRKRSEKNPVYLFTTEELATIYHLPGRVALTPTLERIPSTRGEAPSNLPTG